MSISNRCSRAVVEPLEDRRLLSATHVTAPPFPSVFGLYDGTAVYATGSSQTFTMLVTSQRGGRFAGTSDDFSSFATCKFSGTVTRRGKVHFRMTVERFPGVIVGNGAVNPADTEINAAVRVTLGPRTAKGTFTLVRVQSTSG